MLKLFEPFTLKELTLKNRIMMSPMCQYAVEAEDGAPNAWHRVHYVSRAVGGTGLICLEMTDVVPDGRITVRDLGLWEDRQIPAYAALVADIHRYGAKAGIQLAHAGRKTESPQIKLVGPSAEAFSDRYRVPHALTVSEIADLVAAFARAAGRAVAAGFDYIELHGAHGYLIHQFMSPLSNRRQDAYRDPTRFGIEVIQAVRAAMPPAMVLGMRLSATEYVAGGYDFPALIAMAKQYRDAGIDVFDVSSGGNTPVRPRDLYPGYQVPWAAEIRRQLGVAVIAIGGLETYALAESVLQQEQADVVAIARGHLRDPYWANSAAQSLGGRVQVPEPYWRAYPAAFTHSD